MADTVIAARLSEQPASINLGIVQGATWHGTFTWEVDGVAQDLTGYIPRLSFARRAGAVPYFTLTAGDGLTLEPNAETGVIEVFVGASKSSLLTRDCAYDLILITNDDPEQVVRIAEGAVTVDRAVTKGA